MAGFDFGYQMHISSGRIGHFTITNIPEVKYVTVRYENIAGNISSYFIVALIQSGVIEPNVTDSTIGYYSDPSGGQAYLTRKFNYVNQSTHPTLCRTSCDNVPNSQEKGGYKVVTNYQADFYTNNINWQNDKQFVDLIYLALTTPDTPTFDLAVYSQGTSNPLFTFVWSDLINAVEGTTYYIYPYILHSTGSVIEKLPITSPLIYENGGSLVISFDDLGEIRAPLLDPTVNKMKITPVFALGHYDDRGIYIEDYVIPVDVYNDGDMEGSDPDKPIDSNPETSPEEDDDYNEDTSHWSDRNRPDGTTLDNLMSTSYKVSKANLRALAGQLWNGTFAEGIEKTQNNPIENIVSIKTLPFNVSTSSGTNIKIGNVTTSVVGEPVNDSHKFTVGSVQVPLITTMNGRNYPKFLNYAPYTGVSIYLPYIGVRDLDVNMVMGRTISVEYVYDIVTATCCAIVSVYGSPVHYFEGNCGVDLPISAQNRAQVELAQNRAVVGGVLNTIGSAFSGNILGGASALYNAYTEFASAQYHTTTKGNIGSQLSNHLTNECYLIIERPNYTEPTTYGHDKGYPCELSATLGNLTGFTQCGHSLELSGIPCPVSELDRMRTLLTSGVYITKENIENYAKDLTDNNIVFYKNSSDVLDTNKKLKQLFTVDNIKWKEDTNAINPTFIVHKKTGWHGANYCCVRMLGVDKYFFIDDIVMGKGGILEIKCSCDVLMTYNSYIRGIHTIVTRQEKKTNGLYNDPLIALSSKRIVDTSITVGTVGVDNASIILTVTN